LAAGIKTAPGALDAQTGSPWQRDESLLFFPTFLLERHYTGQDF
jgi:hypothetical protein